MVYHEPPRPTIGQSGFATTRSRRVLKTQTSCCSAGRTFTSGAKLAPPFPFSPGPAPFLERGFSATSRDGRTRSRYGRAFSGGCRGPPRLPAGEADRSRAFSDHGRPSGVPLAGYFRDRFRGHRKPHPPVSRVALRGRPIPSCSPGYHGGGRLSCNQTLFEMFPSWPTWHLVGTAGTGPAGEGQSELREICASAEWLGSGPSGPAQGISARCGRRRRPRIRQ